MILASQRVCSFPQKSYKIPNSAAEQSWCYSRGEGKLYSIIAGRADSERPPELKDSSTWSFQRCVPLVVHDGPSGHPELPGDGVIDSRGNEDAKCAKGHIWINMRITVCYETHLKQNQFHSQMLLSLHFGNQLGQEQSSFRHEEQSCRSKSIVLTLENSVWVSTLIEVQNRDFAKPQNKLDWRQWGSYFERMQLMEDISVALGVWWVASIILCYLWQYSTMCWMHAQTCGLDFRLVRELILHR